MGIVRPKPNSIENEIIEVSTGNERYSNVPVKIASRLSKLYYRDGFTLGRDALWTLLKETQPDAKRGYVDRWLKDQKVHQIYKTTRKSKGVVSFTPIRPIQSLSVDLIDFTNKPASGNMRYILVLVDNFSRFMWAKGISDKTSEKTAKAMSVLLDKIKKEYGSSYPPSYILSDDGSEFKKDYIQLLKKENIRKVRTLGGAPQSNGLVERANGKLKRLLAKHKKIFGGDWRTNLDKCVKIYNSYENTSTGYKSKDAIKLNEEDQKKLRDNVKKAQKESNTNPPSNLELGMKVRFKLPKGKLGKSSDPSWSETIHTIVKVNNPSTEARQTTYILSDKDEDKRYTKNDLQVIDGKVERPPQEKSKERIANNRTATKERNKQAEPRRSKRNKE